MMSDLEKLSDNYVFRERSDYQLRHFVVGQHDTPEMQFRQLLLEARNLLRDIKISEIQVEIAKKRIAKLEQSDNEIDHLKAAQKRIGLSTLLQSIEGARLELDFLVNMSAEYRHYAPEEIEANQAEYWNRRLTRQASADKWGIEQGVSSANVLAMMQAGIVQKELEQ